MTRRSNNAAGAAAVILCCIALILGIGALINLTHSSQPTCNGITMQPGDTCEVTDNNGQTHEETYDDRVAQAQSAPQRGTAFCLGALVCLGAGILVGVLGRRRQQAMVQTSGQALGMPAGRGSASPVPQPTKEAFIQTGNILRTQRHFAKALAAYDRALQLDPTSIDAWNARGALLQQWGRQAEAEQAFARARELQSRR